MVWQRVICSWYQVITRETSTDNLAFFSGDLEAAGQRWAVESATSAASGDVQVVSGEVSFQLLQLELPKIPA